VDGSVLEGTSWVDESMITGEPIPASKAPGEPLTGGTLNGAGALVMRAQRTGDDTLLAQIVRMVSDAQRTRAPIQRVADAVASWFVPTVVAAAVVTFTVWAVVGPEPRLAYALVSAVSVLIIACPCALGLATPMSIMVGTGRGAASGILFRSAEALERLGRIDTLVVDKTGTLTEGRPVLESVVPLGGFEEADVLRLAASIEQASEHPLGRAIVAAARARGLATAAPADVQSVPGEGIAGTVDGRRVAVGSRRYLQKAGIGATGATGPTGVGGAAGAADADGATGAAGVTGAVGTAGIGGAVGATGVGGAADAAGALDRAATGVASGRTLVFVAIDGRAAGVFAIGDPVKAGTAEAIRALHARGIRIVMLTGDARATAEAVARPLGIDTIEAEVLPARKAEVVARLRAEGRVVAMAGDGVNDAPALASADVGIAMGTGADVAIESAGVTLVKGDLRGIDRALSLSRATMRNIRQNLFFAFVYNLIGVPIAAGVLYPVLGLVLSPMLASAAMSLSSVSVIGNALRLRRTEL
jgi:Cu+-exporting ATPase